PHVLENPAESLPDIAQRERPRPDARFEQAITPVSLELEYLDPPLKQKARRGLPDTRQDVIVAELLDQAGGSRHRLQVTDGGDVEDEHAALAQVPAYAAEEAFPGREREQVVDALVGA